MWSSSAIRPGSTHHVQRRHPQEQARTATKGKPAKPAASKRTASKSKPVAIPTRQKAAGALFGSLALTMAGLSLSHLASGFAMATHRPMTEGWVMASATDIGFVAAELLPFLATGAACGGPEACPLRTDSGRRRRVRLFQRA